MKIVRVELRVPERIKAELELLAKKDGRSLNNYINMVLEKAITGGGK